MDDAIAPGDISTRALKAWSQSKRRQRRPHWWRGHELALAGALFLLVVILGAVFAPALTPHSPTDPNIRERLRPPSLSHPFGTDELGRDILTRVLFGARPVLLTGATSVLVALVLGGLIGGLSGFYGGLVDTILMRLMDLVLSFPAILLAILIVAALGAGMGNLVIAIAFSMIPIFARLGRSLALRLRQQDYVLAGRTIGCTDAALLRRHIMPNLIPLLLVQAVSMLAVAFSTSAALSFLGLGVAPPTPDWGLMVSEGQRLIFDAPHVPFFPGLMITLTVMSMNFVGDSLHQYVDPTLRQR
ncbi:MAG: ABC transporter permease [Chloroflexaceae bacterium]